MNRRSALLGLFTLTAAGCAGAGTSVPAGSGRSTNALAQAGLTLPPAATPAPSGSPLTVLQTSGITPAYSTAPNAALTTTAISGYTFAAAADGSFTNVFGSNGAFLAQFDTATTGANGMPNLRVVGNNGQSLACNLFDVSQVPANTTTMIGTSTLYYDAAANTATVTIAGQTVSTAYDASGNLVATLPGGSSMTYRAATVAAAAAKRIATAVTSPGRLHAQDFLTTGPCLALYALAAACVAAALAALAIAIACGVGATWAAIFCAIKLADALTGISILAAATWTLINSQCLTGYKPTPAPIPTETPEPTLPIHSNLPYAQ